MPTRTATWCASRNGSWRSAVDMPPRRGLQSDRSLTISCVTTRLLSHRRAVLSAKPTMVIAVLWYGWPTRVVHGEDSCVRPDVTHQLTGEPYAYLLRIPQGDSRQAAAPGCFGCNRRLRSAGGIRGRAHACGRATVEVAHSAVVAEIGLRAWERRRQQLRPRDREGRLPRCDAHRHRQWLLHARCRNLGSPAADQRRVLEPRSGAIPWGESASTAPLCKGACRSVHQPVPDHQQGRGEQSDSASRPFAAVRVLAGCRQHLRPPGRHRRFGVRRILGAHRSTCPRVYNIVASGTYPFFKFTTHIRYHLRVV